jgi:hypothetical protein
MVLNFIKAVMIWSLVLFLFGCKQDKAPDVSHIEANMNIIRTENALKNLKNVEELKLLKEKNPSFYKIYFSQVLGLSSEDNDSIFTAFEPFKNDSLTREVLKIIEKRFTQDEFLQSDIQKMYQYLLYYFPDKLAVPNIYTFISDFAYQIFIFEDDGKKDGIAVGLDMFLYPDIPYKKIDPDNTNFSDYITRAWNADHISKKIADIHVADLIGEAPGHRLIDQMIHNGKALYITKLLLPEKHDSIIHEYTGAQMEFCEENELQMWSFFFDQKLFFETNPTKIAKYIFPSPQSPDMPDDAPGRTANYIGWKIVKAYMERYPETTLEQLINMTDSQQVMDKSKYRPKQK